MNQREKALEALEGAVAGWGYRPGDAIAHVHVTLGAYDDAIRELERACEQRSSSLHGVGIAPEFVPLRSDKRFRSILQRIGLEPEKDVRGDSVLIIAQSRRGRDRESAHRICLNPAAPRAFQRAGSQSDRNTISTSSNAGQV